MSPCTKHPYPTSGAGHEALKREQKAWRRRLRRGKRSRANGEHPPRLVYLCPVCKSWHLTGTEGAPRGR